MADKLKPLPRSKIPASTYDPRGVLLPGSGMTGAPGSVVTGDPQVDVNTDFNSLNNRLLDTAQNDQAYSTANDTQLRMIRLMRETADAKRAADLRNDGMSAEQVDVRLHPHLWDKTAGGIAPTATELEQRKVTDAAKAVSGAESMGRSNVHAIAQKYIRNGMPPAMAYQAAMGVMPTTDPRNLGAVPSLPAVDPLRAITNDPRTAAGVVGVGHNTVQEQNNQLQYGLGMGQQNTSLAQEIIKARTAADTNQTARDVGGVGSDMQQRQAMEWLRVNPGAHASPDPSMRTLHKQMSRQAAGLPVVEQAPQQMIQPGNQGVMPAQSPDNGGYDQILMNDPTAMAQYLNGFQDPNRRAHEEAKIYIRAGQPDHPVVRNFARNRLQTEDPNLFRWSPDWLSSGVNAATGGGSTRHELGGGWLTNNYQIPYPTAMNIAKGYYGGQ